mmetsp:Transcript_38922/g.111353  ORF Transcript_38922/g.111353 Transcript_38922/m.111353 type:complete len:677 (+) Transcript_38922:464-2494(+)
MRYACNHPSAHGARDSWSQSRHHCARFARSGGGQVRHRGLSDGLRPLLHANALRGQLCQHWSVPLRAHGPLHARPEALRGAVEQELRADGGGQADCARHRRRTAGDAVLDQRGHALLHGTVAAHAHELVLHDDHVALLGQVGHLRALQQLRDDVDGLVRRGLGRHRTVARQPQPRHEASAGADGLGAQALGGQRLPDGGLEVGARGARAQAQVLRQPPAEGPGLPWRSGQRRRRARLQQAQVREGQHALAEAPVAEGAAEEGGRVRDAVQLGERRGVSIRQHIQGERVVERQRPRVGEQLVPGHLAELPVLAPPRGIPCRQQHPLRAPAEFVAQGAGAHRFRGRQPAAQRGEADDVPLRRLHLVDHLHCAHVVDAWVQARLVHDQHPGGARLVVKRLHLRTDVRGGDHVLLVLDREPCDAHVEAGWHQRHHNVRSADEGLRRGQGLRCGRGDVHYLGPHSRAEAPDEDLDLLLGSAGHSQGVLWAAQQVLDQRAGDEARTQDEDLPLGPRELERGAAARLRRLGPALRPHSAQGDLGLGRHAFDLGLHLLEVLVRLRHDEDGEEGLVADGGADVDAQDVQAGLRGLHEVAHPVDGLGVEEVPGELQRRAGRRTVRAVWVHARVLAGGARVVRVRAAEATELLDVAEVPSQLASLRDDRPADLGGELLGVSCVRQVR